MPTASPTLPAAIGRFQIRSVLGAGAFGTVYRAFDPRLQREVALKVAHPGSLDDPRRVQRFLREARATAKLRHPNIVPVFDAGVDQGQHYIAATFIDGATLSELVVPDRTDFEQSARIVRALAEALDHAHRHGIIHRDVKPANVRVDSKGEPHLLDFGIAHLHENSEKLTHDGAVLGTPTYMAPEQARGGDVDGYSDIYGLGIVAYHALTGRPPFVGGNSVEILVQHLNRPAPALAPRCPEAPVGLVELVERMLAKNYAERPTAAEVQDTIGWLCTDSTSPAYMFMTEEPTAPRPRTQLDERDTTSTLLMRSPITR